MSDVDERIKLFAELERYREERSRLVDRGLSLVGDAGAPEARLPPMTPNEQARKRELDDIIRSFERAIERLDASPAAGGSQPMIWLGTGAELGALILALQAGEKITLQRGQRKIEIEIVGKKIPAETPTEALREATRHFVRKNGKPFTVDSLMESERGKRGFQEGKRPKQ